MGSSIARATDAGIYLHAGPEIGVASTKAFSAQILALSMLALKLGRERGELTKEQMTCETTVLVVLVVSYLYLFSILSRTQRRSRPRSWLSRC